MVTERSVQECEGHWRVDGRDEDGARRGVRRLLYAVVHSRAQVITDTVPISKIP